MTVSVVLFLIAPRHGTHRLIRLLCRVFAVFAFSCAFSNIQAQNLPDPTLEQRRALEREQSQQRAFEQEPDIRLKPEVPASQERIPQDEAPCFPIKKIRLEGPEPTVQVSRFDWVLDQLGGTQQDSPVGRCLGVKGISVVVSRAQNAIIARGWITTQVLTRPQNLSTEELVLTVVPGRIRKVRFSEGSSIRGTLWNAVPAHEGDILNLRDIEQALENFKRVPTANANIKIEPTDQPGLSDVVIAYEQSFPMRLSVFADNSGTTQTGKYQGGVTLHYDNPLTLNDLLSVTMNQSISPITSSERGTKGYSIFYSVPYGYWTLSAMNSGSNYYQTVVGPYQNYVYSGTSNSSELKISRMISRDADSKTSVSGKAWQRLTNNYIDNLEVDVQRRIEAGWEIGLNHKQYWGQATLEGNLAYRRGTWAFGAIAAPEAEFGEASSQFGLFLGDLNLTLPFKVGSQSMRYNGSLRGQFSPTALTPLDQFFIGGRYTVRGFDGERLLSASSGWLVRNDLSFALGNTGQEVFVGLDHGQVSGATTSPLVGTALTGSVIGVRGTVERAQYELFIGRPISKPVLFQASPYTAGFSVSYSI